MADWAPKNGIKTVVSLVTDYGPGLDAEKYFRDRFLFNGGTVVLHANTRPAEMFRVPFEVSDLTTSVGVAAWVVSARSIDVAPFRDEQPAAVAPAAAGALALVTPAPAAALALVAPAAAGAAGLAAGAGVGAAVTGGLSGAALAAAGVRPQSAHGTSQAHRGCQPGRGAAAAPPM